MKIRPKEILEPLFIFLIFLGFVVGGISLIIYGYNHDNDVELTFGLVVACLGLFQIFQRYKVGYVFAVIPILLVVVSLSGTFIFILFYIPFFYKESLNLDLGALILKDWFVRLVIIIIDVLLLVNVFTFNKKRLSKNKEQEKGQY
ncbi:hypothetical protein LF887_13925 [Chryseobacterium sp. MEBOG06]|uniref:hypothetical protein n=1 Tax=Chryseobacterium sp. MEBOG06 TaxID=2879938 RepID=UPI001F193F47|nr:hypothetical protein [Chryseobacterium sp. MEBOG06]UKB82105.1 hypothetical protein LF887_13925 [Chryseobacterium sp. MEBOG06]